MIVYSDVINHKINLDLENISPNDKQYKFVIKHILQKLGQQEKRLIKGYIMRSLLNENHRSESFFNKIRYRKNDNFYKEADIMLSVALEADEIQRIEKFFKIESLLTQHYNKVFI